jgi:hypothetical protein
MSGPLPNLRMANPPLSDNPGLLHTKTCIPSCLPQTQMCSPLELHSHGSYRATMFSLSQVWYLGSPPSITDSPSLSLSPSLSPSPSLPPPPSLSPSPSLFLSLSLPSPGILKVPPLSALPSHWLSESLCTDQNQLWARSLNVLCMGHCKKVLGEHN